MLLHGSHFVKIHILKAVEDFILQVEFVKTHKNRNFNFLILHFQSRFSEMSCPKSVAGVQPVMRTFT